MRARLWQWYEDINDSFWLRPSFIVLCAIALAEFMINAERWDIVPAGFLKAWVYSGGETGARTLLGAVAGSTIGVAGTVFSITIATLTLASNQLGPRLLRNFTRDRGNQATLGIYLGTFAYALIVLRSVRGADQGAFVPHMAVTGAILLALLCVAMLIFFVNHVASRINFDTVIELVYRDVCHSLAQLTAEIEQAAAPDRDYWKNGDKIALQNSGYIQQLDETAIADWADREKTAIRLYARPGDFVFPGAPLAVAVPKRDGAAKAVAEAIVLGPYPTLSMDVEYAVEQLVDVAVRALSPGINDPRTAVRILDRMGAALCVVADKPLPSGVIEKDGRVVFQRDTTTYEGLMDTMFHVIRQSARGSTPVLMHMIEVLTNVARREDDANRLMSVRRHAELVLADGARSIPNADDLADLQDSGRNLFQAIGAHADCGQDGR